MTDRVHSLTVVLETDMRTDDVEGVINAILHLKPVISVEKHISDVGTLMAEARAKQELRMKLFEVLK
jgi:hypothetical protein